MWDIDLSLIEPWIVELGREDYELLVAALRVLSEDGPTLGRPLVDSIQGSSVKNMKELRPASTGGSELRVLFAFDPKRRAILLVAGDKARRWKKWYEENIPIAERRFAEHLARLKADEGATRHGNRQNTKRKPRK